MKKIIQTLGCLIVGASSLTAGVTVDITFTDPSDTVLTATISGQSTIVASPSLTKWEYEAGRNLDWRDMNRDSDVNILPGGGDIREIVVTNSSAIVSNGINSATVTHVDFYSGGTRNDFGFNFDQNPSFSGGDVVTFSGSFDFALPGKTAADFSIGTWTENRGVHWQYDLTDFGNLTLTVSQVPEPSTYAAIAGIFVAGWVFMRRRSSARV